MRCASTGSSILFNFLALAHCFSRFSMQDTCQRGSAATPPTLLQLCLKQQTPRPSRPALCHFKLSSRHLLLQL